MTDSPDLRMLGEREHDDATGDSFFKDESVDTSAHITPQTFNSTEFLAGVRPTRRSVQIVERADLVGDMERLAQLYAEADDADDDAACEALAAEFGDVSAQFHASKRWYTVEKRSSEWVEDFRAKLEKQHSLDFGDGTDENPGNPRHRRIAMQHQLAEQIVSPEGTTFDDLQGLYERNEGELNKLIVALTVVNTQQATAAKVATPGFSLRRSGKKGKDGS